MPMMVNPVVSHELAIICPGSGMIVKTMACDNGEDVMVFGGAGDESITVMVFGGAYNEGIGRMVLGAACQDSKDGRRSMIVEGS